MDSGKFSIEPTSERQKAVATEYANSLGYDKDKEATEILYSRDDFIAGSNWQKEQSRLIPEDMGVIYNLVRTLQEKYSDVSSCYEEALKLFNDAKRESNKG